LANRHLKRYGHKATIDERSLKAQGSKRNPTRHKGVRMKVKGSSFDGIRPSYPRSPVVTTTKTIGTDGSIRVRAVIKHSALNSIGNKPPALSMQQTRKGWPEAAIRDWETWGSKDVGRFFTVWRELAPSNFSPAGGLHA
jgi:hypothetical protein